MSKGLNRVLLIGNVCRDPENRAMPSGEAVTNLSIACNNQWKNKAGEKQESVEFVNVVFFGKLAEIAGEHLRKGSKVYVEGSLRTRSWEKDGIKRYATEVVAREMLMLGGGEQGKPRDQAYSEASSTKQPAGFDDFVDDDPNADIPW